MKLIRSNTLLRMMRLESVIPMLAIPLIFIGIPFKIKVQIPMAIRAIKLKFIYLLEI